MDYIQSHRYNCFNLEANWCQRYIVPLIKPPTPPELEQDKALVTAKFEEAQQILENLKAETSELRESQEKQRQTVEESLEAVDKALNEIRAAENRREANIRGFKADIDAIRELIPKVRFLSWNED